MEDEQIALALQVSMRQISEVKNYVYTKLAQHPDLQPTKGIPKGAERALTIRHYASLRLKFPQVCNDDDTSKAGVWRKAVRQWIVEQKEIDRGRTLTVPLAEMLRLLDYRISKSVKRLNHVEDLRGSNMTLLCPCLGSLGIATIKPRSLVRQGVHLDRIRTKDLDWSIFKERVEVTFGMKLEIWCCVHFSHGFKQCRIDTKEVFRALVSRLHVLGPNIFIHLERPDEEVIATGDSTEVPTSEDANIATVLDVNPTPELSATQQEHLDLITKITTEIERAREDYQDQISVLEKKLAESCHERLVQAEQMKDLLEEREDLYENIAHLADEAEKLDGSHRELYANIEDIRVNVQELEFQAHQDAATIGRLRSDRDNWRFVAKRAGLRQLPTYVVD